MKYKDLEKYIETEGKRLDDAYFDSISYEEIILEEGEHIWRRYVKAGVNRKKLKHKVKSQNVKRVTQ